MTGPAADEAPAATADHEPVPPPSPVAKDLGRRASATDARGGFRLAELIWLCLGVVDAFLALDFLLKAIAAQGPGFVSVVTGVGDALANPFIGVFSGQAVPQVDHTTFWAALVAIVVYTVAAWLAIRLLRLLAAPPVPRAGGR
ncbi:MAG: hypothetical protein ACREOA_08605 [Candidatus Dormibacteria bacterium]